MVKFYMFEFLWDDGIRRYWYGLQCFVLKTIHFMSILQLQLVCIYLGILSERTCLIFKGCFGFTPLPPPYFSVKFWIIYFSSNCFPWVSIASALISLSLSRWNCLMCWAFIRPPTLGLQFSHFYLLLVGSEITSISFCPLHPYLCSHFGFPLYNCQF